MPNYAKLPTWADKRHIYAVVETPRGSSCKVAFDRKLKAFTLSKPLLAGLAYPYDWGFVPSTKADDGDPLDVLIIHDAPTYPGVVLRCEPIGVPGILQTAKGKTKRNDRVFALPERSPSEGDFHDVTRLSARARRELEKFFQATNALQDKPWSFSDGRGRRTQSRQSKDTDVYNVEIGCQQRFGAALPNDAICVKLAGAAFALCSTSDRSLEHKPRSLRGAGEAACGLR